MIEKAFVSGQIARSIFKEEDNLFILNAKETEEISDCTPYEKSLFFSSGAEIKVFENITIDELREKLMKEKACFDAMYGAIAGFDPDLSEETRILSIQRAEELVKVPGILDFLKSRFLGNPVPKEAALKQALKLSNRNGFKEMGFLYHILLNNKEVIKYILATFEETILKLALDKEFVEIKNTFINYGIFTSLFWSTTEKNLKDLNTLVFQYSADENVKEKVPRVFQVLTRMKTQLGKKYKMDRTRAKKPGKLKQEKAQRFNLHNLITRDEPISIDENETKKKRKRAKGKRIIDNIDSQIERIIKEIKKENYYQANKYAYQLIKYNLESSKKIYVCKTLCNIASNLMKLCQFDLAEEYVGNALLLNVNDAFPYTIKAEILKARGDYQGALNICEDIIEKFPQETVPRTIKAEILKARGDYQGALNICEDIIEKFPQEVVPRNIKAEILKARGDYQGALNICEDTIEKFPQDVVPRTIKAEILKARGDYQGALNICEETIEKLTFTPVVKHVKLSILFLMDELQESDFTILNKIPGSEDDFIEYHMLGMFYLRQGKLDKAIEIFEYGFQNNNAFEQKKYFVSALCVAKNRQKQFKEAKDILFENEEILQADDLSQLVLIRSTAETGDIETAEKIACRLKTIDAHSSNLRDGLICRYGLNCECENPLDASPEELEIIIAREEEYLLAAS
jgi:tetratricopeptide (TPR) repeat protein